MLPTAFARVSGTQIATTEQPDRSIKEPIIVHPGDGVAAIVNDSVISDYDLNQRIALFLATSGAQPPPDKMAQIRAQILKQLETERLQLLEAQRKNISVSAADVDKAVDNIVKENNLTQAQLQEMLTRGGVALSTLRTQIAIGIAWCEDRAGRIRRPTSTSRQKMSTMNSSGSPKVRPSRISSWRRYSFRWTIPIRTKKCARMPRG